MTENRNLAEEDVDRIVEGLWKRQQAPIALKGCNFYSNV